MLATLLSVTSCSALQKAYAHAAKLMGYARMRAGATDISISLDDDYYFESGRGRGCIVRRMKAIFGRLYESKSARARLEQKFRRLRDTA